MAEGRLKKAWSTLIGKEEKVQEQVLKEPKPQAFYGTHNHSFAVHYDGEKNLGEIGPIKEYFPDYTSLRLRSWQSYLDSEITQSVINKFALWIIGSGLKLQSEPALRVLQSERINIDIEDFNDLTEAKFALFCKSKKTDYCGRKSLNKLAKSAIINAIVGGDVLVIQRFVKGRQTTQLIDGAHVQSPLYGNDLYAAAKANGNEIRHGIELSPTGEHIAYYVRGKGFEYERIPAKSKSSGLVTAFLVYGLEYRLDNHRGLPLISAVLETLKKLERYKEATVGSAEERQKIAYFIKHELGSTGENPLSKQLAKAFNADAELDDIPEDIQGKKLADTVAASTNKQVFNMPVNSSLEALESKNELYFKDFYTVNIDLICAALGIPPNVAMSKYDSNFSASRAALKEWEHTINVNRADFSEQFYQPIYNYWLDVEILKNKIQAPGYLEARQKDNEIVLDSYRNARFVGVNVPHIDPEKEVKAERLKLGDTGNNIPLTTVERSTENVNGGDAKQNIIQYAKELQEANSLGIKQETSHTQQ